MQQVDSGETFSGGPGAAVGPPFEPARLPLIEALQGTALAFAVGIAIIVPRASPVFVVILAILVVFEAGRTGQLFDVLRSTGAPVYALLVFLVWAGGSALWASDASFTARSVGQASLVVVAGLLIVLLFPRQIEAMPEWRQRHQIRPVAFGFMSGLAYLAVEFLSGHALSFRLIERFPSLMGDNVKEFARDGDRLIDLLPFFLDRNTAALTLMLPAAWLCIRRLLPTAVIRPAIVVIFAISAIVIAVSWSGAAKLALVSGGLGALLWWRNSSIAGRLFTWGSVAVVVLAIPVILAASRIGLAENSSLPPSVRERVVIWTNTATAVLNAPIIGIGAQSTRFQQEMQAKRIDGIRGESRRALGWHAHNAVLQVWLELGAVGAALLLAWLVSLPRAINQIGPHSGAAAAGLVTMMCAVSLTGWGVWQPWLIGVYATAAAALCVIRFQPGS